MIPVIAAELNIAADKLESGTHDPYLVLLLRAGASAMVRVKDLEKDAEWRRRYHSVLGRGMIETEGHFYERLVKRVNEMNWELNPERMGS